MAAKTPSRANACLMVVAAAGYGKTTWLTGQTHPGGLYVTARELVTADVRGLAVGVDTLAIDDLDDLPPEDLSVLLRALTELPNSLRILMGSRTPLSGRAREMLRRPLVDRGAADLALDLEATARVLREQHGVADTDVSEQVHRLSGGWPALVHYSGDVLGRQRIDPSELLKALTDRDAAAADWAREEVLSRLEADEARVTDFAADVSPVTAVMCAELATLIGLPEPRAADAALQGVAALARTGVLIPDPDAGASRSGEALHLVPFLAEVVRADRGMDAMSDAIAWQRAASTWFEHHGYALDAALGYLKAGDRDAALRLVESRAAEMLAAGGADQVARLLASVPASERSVRAQLILADSLRIAGDPGGASRAFEPLTKEADRSSGWTAELAWRAAMVHYMRGEYRDALELCETALPAVSPDAIDLDSVQLFAVRASSLAMIGQTDESRASAVEALVRADASGDDRARAAAHIAAALTETGEGRGRNLLRALEAAERADDVLQMTRVLVNQADMLLDDAKYAQAHFVALRALRTAEQGAPPGMVVVALYNLGEAQMRLGRFGEASYSFERSTRLARRSGLHRAAPGLLGMAEVDFQLGRLEQSRMEFEEAIELSRAASEMQILVPALAGLIRLLLGGDADDVIAARQAADEAEAVAPRVLLPTALVARGWVALVEGDRALAQKRADRALTTARSGGSIAALAESLQLAAAVSSDAETARRHLREAGALWQRAGATPEADRILVQLSRLPGADGTDRVAAREAGQRLLAIGIRVVHGQAPLPVAGASATIHIRVLGGFDVLIGGRPVPRVAWRSRQARTLVKILAARRGRPIARIELSEILWPDDDMLRTSHRLSVLLSVVRGVLDPTKAWDADHYIRADQMEMSLDLGHVTIDALDFLRDAALAGQLARSGDTERARKLLIEVDNAHHGNAFDEEPYEDWANALREETRSVWMGVLRTDAALAQQVGEFDHAVTSLVRLLAEDPSDDSAHRLVVELLVKAGRHGEARRAFDRWTGAMALIDAPKPNKSFLNTVGHFPPDIGHE
jgi:DNA-binding SARP family transcriptional activator